MFAVKQTNLKCFRFWFMTQTLQNVSNAVQLWSSCLLTNIYQDKTPKRKLYLLPCDLEESDAIIRLYTLTDKMESFWPKKFEFLAELIFDPEFREITRYWELKLTKFTFFKFFKTEEVNDLKCFTSTVLRYLITVNCVNLTHNIKSIWPLNFESIWLKYCPITRNLGSNFSSASDSTF